MLGAPQVPLKGMPSRPLAKAPSVATSAIHKAAKSIPKTHLKQPEHQLKKSHTSNPVVPEVPRLKAARKDLAVVFAASNDADSLRKRFEAAQELDKKSSLKSWANKHKLGQQEVKIGIFEYVRDGHFTSQDARKDVCDHKGGYGPLGQMIVAAAVWDGADRYSEALRRKLPNRSIGSISASYGNTLERMELALGPKSSWQKIEKPSVETNIHGEDEDEEEDDKEEEYKSTEDAQEDEEDEEEEEEDGEKEEEEQGEEEDEEEEAEEEEEKDDEDESKDGGEQQQAQAKAQAQEPDESETENSDIDENMLQPSTMEKRVSSDPGRETLFVTPGPQQSSTRAIRESSTSEVDIQASAQEARNHRPGNEKSMPAHQPSALHKSRPVAALELVPKADLMKVPKAQSVVDTAAELTSISVQTTETAAASVAQTIESDSQSRHEAPFDVLLPSPAFAATTKPKIDLKEPIKLNIKAQAQNAMDDYNSTRDFRDMLLQIQLFARPSAAYKRRAEAIQQADRQMRLFAITCAQVGRRLRVGESDKKRKRELGDGGGAETVGQETSKRIKPERAIVKHDLPQNKETKDEKKS